MYSLQDFKDDIDQLHMEVTFRYKGHSYLISDSIENEKGIYIGGPENDEFVQDTDAVLDTLLVDGFPMRQMMQHINPD